MTFYTTTSSAISVQFDESTNSVLDYLNFTGPFNITFENSLSQTSISLPRLIINGGTVSNIQNVFFDDCDVLDVDLTSIDFFIQNQKLKAKNITITAKTNASSVTFIPNGWNITTISLETYKIVPHYLDATYSLNSYFSNLTIIATSFEDLIPLRLAERLPSLDISMTTTNENVFLNLINNVQFQTLIIMNDWEEYVGPSILTINCQAMIVRTYSWTVPISFETGLGVAFSISV